MRGAPSLQELFGISDVMEFKERQSNALGDALTQNYRYYEDERLREEERRRRKFAKERQIQGALVGGGLGAIFAPALGLAASPAMGAMTGAKIGSQVGQDDLVGAAQTGIGAYLGGQKTQKAAEDAQYEKKLEADQTLFDRSVEAAKVYWTTGQDLEGYFKGKKIDAQAQLPAQGGQLPGQAQLPAQGGQLPAQGGRRLMSPKMQQENQILIDKEKRAEDKTIAKEKRKFAPQKADAIEAINLSIERVTKVLNKGIPDKVLQKETDLTKGLAQSMKGQPFEKYLPSKSGDLEKSSGNYWNMAMAKWNPGSKQYDFAADIKQIEAANAINGLMKIKRASPTGGALGSVTEGELEILKNLAANLSLGQSPEQLRERLETFRTELKKTLNKIEGFEEAVGSDKMGLR